MVNIGVSKELIDKVENVCWLRRQKKLMNENIQYAPLRQNNTSNISMPALSRKNFLSATSYGLSLPTHHQNIFYFPIKF